MKKIFFALTFFCCLGSSVSAQESGFRFGFQASPTWSWLRSSDKFLEGAGANWGMKLGMLGEIYFAPNYAITSGIGFGFNQGGTLQTSYQKGVYFPNSAEGFTSSVLDTMPLNAKMHYRLRYVEIPFSLRIRGGSGVDARVQYFAELPIFTLGFRSKAAADFRGTQNQNSEDEDIKDDINGLSLSWGLGGGIEYDLAGDTKLATGIYWQQQFTDADTDKGSVTDPRTGNTEWKRLNSNTTGRQLSLRLAIFF